MILRRVSAVAAGCVAFAGAGIAIAISASSDSEPQAASTTPMAPATAGPTTGASAITTAAQPNTTTTQPLGPDISWRAGYAGLGPIRLGMTVDEAAAAVHAAAQPGDGGCVVGLDPLPGSELPPGAVSVSPRTVDQISIGSPRILTISGIRVGDTVEQVMQTYPSATEGFLIDDGVIASGYRDVLVIRNAEGRVVLFWIQDGRVRSITIALSLEAWENNRRC